mmetsp:Transcript_63518/g.101082  ORF Transcript_63518/g.101082 Transcript_63518/m.101082 type:complete len:126 (+) Transcript_63518:444-821(+)
MIMTHLYGNRKCCWRPFNKTNAIRKQCSIRRRESNEMSMDIEAEAEEEEEDEREDEVESEMITDIGGDIMKRRTHTKEEAMDMEMDISMIDAEGMIMIMNNSDMRDIIILSIMRQKEDEEEDGMR